MSCFFLHFQVFLWMHHLRDWIWERLKLWRTFKGLQPSKPPPPPLTVSNLNSSCFTQTPNCFLDFHPLFFCFPFIRSTLAIEAERIFLVQMDLWSKSLTLKRNRLEQTVEGYPQPSEQGSQTNGESADLLTSLQLLHPKLTNLKFGLNCISLFCFVFYIYFEVWIHEWGSLGKIGDYIHCFLFLFIEFPPTL